MPYAALPGEQHETVNLAVTGSIVTLLQLAYKANINVPFFFGGDDATSKVMHEMGKMYEAFVLW